MRLTLRQRWRSQSKWSLPSPKLSIWSKWMSTSYEGIFLFMRINKFNHIIEHPTVLNWNRWTQLVGISQDFKRKTVFNQRRGAAWGPQGFLWRVKIILNLWGKWSIKIENLVGVGELNFKQLTSRQEFYPASRANWTETSQSDDGGALHQPPCCHHFCYCLLGHWDVQRHVSWQRGGNVKETSFAIGAIHWKKWPGQHSFCTLLCV